MATRLHTWVKLFHCRRCLTALLAKIDQEIADADALSHEAPEPLVRQQAKMLIESLKLDRQATEKLLSNQ